jgi:hypothetical protein
MTPHRFEATSWTVHLYYERLQQKNVADQINCLQCVSNNRTEL